jgi:hypothetical protein
MLDPDSKHCLSPHVLEEKKGGVGGEGEDGGHGEHVAVLHRLHPAIKLPTKKNPSNSNSFSKRGSETYEENQFLLSKKDPSSASGSISWIWLRIQKG